MKKTTRTRSQSLPMISLYTGAGGLDVGLESAGFDVRVCVEFDRWSVETMRANKAAWRVINENIHNVPTRRILEAAGLHKGEVALLAGGPPCQPFSKSGFWVQNGARGLHDPRAGTLKEYLRVLAEVLPRAFIMENVHGLAYNIHENALGLVLDRAQALGYTVDFAVLNAADYGVPQIRKRLFIIGALGVAPVHLPPPTHRDPDQGDVRGTLPGMDMPPYVTALEALKGTDEPRYAEPEHESVGGKWGHLLPEIPEGDNYLFLTAHRGHPRPLFEWRSRYWSFLLKLARNKPSWTIQAQPGPYIGPFHWENRRLRTIEIKRLQTFPDEYEIAGSRNEVQRQLGNAVPPLLAEVIGRTVRRCLTG